MKTITILLAALFTVSAQAADKKIDLRPHHKKVEDPGSATPLLYKKAPPPSVNAGSGSGVKVTATCTDSLGMVIQSDDKAYEACLRDQDKSRLSNPTEKKPNSLGISIGN